MNRADHDVLLLHLAHDGRLTNPRVVDVLRDRLAGATDCFVFCPGWIADPIEGRQAAARFFSLFDGALRLLRERITPLRVAVHWPSRPFAATPAVEDRPAMDDTLPELTGSLGGLSRASRDILSHLLGSFCEMEVPLGPEEELELDALIRQARDAARGVGEALTPLHSLAFWLTKRRAGQVGERLGREWLAPLIAEIRPKAPRVHLIGHSFGAKLLTSAVLGGARPESLVLLLAAFSAFAFAEEVPHMARPGAYRRVVAERLVNGPIVALRSDHDRVLGTLYPAAAWSAQTGRSVTAGGRHGRTHELVTRSAMGAVGARGVGAPELDLLDVQRTGLPRCVVNVDGSSLVKRAGPLVGAHGDIYHGEIATLLLLAGGLLRGDPEGVRLRPTTPWDTP